MAKPAKQSAVGKPAPSNKILMTKERVLDALGLVVDGKTYDEIAKTCGISRRTLCDRLDALPESAHLRAREASAEAWLDRGFEKLEECLQPIPIGASVEEVQILKAALGYQVQAAKNYEQACARRASLRNRKYADKTVHEHTGEDGGAIQMVTRIELVAG